jgi:FKBP-type peptidyl-prolyl cis-trans isomerase FklB
MKRIVVLTMGLLIMLVSVAQNKSKSTKPATAKPVSSKSAGSAATGLKSGLDSFSYAMGVSVGKFYKQQGLNTIKSDLMLKGITDAMNESKKPLMDEMQCNMVVQSYITGIKSKKADAAKLKSHQYLDSVSKLPGVVKLPSGLQYKVIKAGSDTMHPKVTDTVKFNYRGMLANGTEFDNSFTRGEPLVHPVNQLVPGLTEALQLMTPGSKWMVYIPSDLGYGDAGAGDLIPGGAVIVFEMELLEILNRK